MNPKILMLAGEASGDLHCSRLASKIKEICPSVELFGMGGSLMAQAGVKLEYDISNSAVMGITEVAGKLPLMLKRLKGLKRFIHRQKPDVVVMVDFPDFNMRLLPFIHKRHIPIVYYIPPKAWAWRRKRADVLAKYVSTIASIFPFEAEVYQQAGANVHYVGHPLLDFAGTSLSQIEAREKFQLDNDKPVIGLMPGSRIKEINKLLNVMLDSAKLIKSEIPDCQFILPVAHTIPKDMIPDLGDFLKIADGSQVYEVMKACDMMIIASGTATLEAAYMLTPMIVIYKVSLAFWIIGNMLVKVKSTALPNIIADKMIVPELLQDKAEAKSISQIAVKMMQNTKELEKQRMELKEVRNKLGSPGAVERTARLVLQYIK